MTSSASVSAILSSIFALTVSGLPTIQSRIVRSRTRARSRSRGGHRFPRAGRSFADRRRAGAARSVPWIWKDSALPRRWARRSPRRRGWRAGSANRSVGRNAAAIGVECRSGRGGGKVGGKGIAEPVLARHLRRGARRSQKPDRGQGDLAGHDADLGKGVIGGEIRPARTPGVRRNFPESFRRQKSAGRWSVRPSEPPARPMPKSMRHRIKAGQGAVGFDDPQGHVVGQHHPARRRH